MALTAIDWAIVAAYFILSVGIGLYFTKRGGESLNEYFLSGRQVTWWLAGASMVATTFAACFLTYEIVRRVPLLRPLFGLKFSPKPSSSGLSRRPKSAEAAE